MLNWGDNSSKTTNIIQLMKSEKEKKEVFYSIELYPRNKSRKIYNSFFTKMGRHEPLFYSLMCNRLDETFRLITKFPSNTLIHLPAQRLSVSDVLKICDEALKLNIVNILALQGDSHNDKKGDFRYARDLVKFLRSRYGSTFTIGVAGYPEMHPMSESKDQDLYYLKKKVDAGADFIITQIFFDSKIFIDFVKDCRYYGIDVPIIPGIFPFPSFRSLVDMAHTCKLEVPSKIMNDMKNMTNDTRRMQDYGIKCTIYMIEDIIKNNAAHGFHIFTLNNFPLMSEFMSQINIPELNRVMRNINV